MPARRRTALALVSAVLFACTPEKGETTATDATTDATTGTTTGATAGATTDATTASVTTASDPPTTGGTTEPAATSSESTTTAAATSTGDDTSGSETTTSAETSSSTSGDTTDTGDPVLCEGTSMSSLPGVTIVFPPQPCTFTVAEAHSGVVFHYEVHVEAALPDVQRYRQDAGDCDEPEASGLIVAPRIFGGDEMYCFCNQGLCPGLDIPPTTLQPGVYPGELEWKGWNWQGPHVDLGPAFPPGEYVVQERAIGSFKSADADVDYEVLAQLPITLLP
ncbi:hypothetical protein OV090_41570 [Nannocystis sp. RBIL2]|uniref:hypothetical protein n=1 Tax=Nannocystis sp. RBIL2 TaxID=2996788 RepID=UPI00227015BF|nr:hypothetical protein [Nannocystis sp. RBIL2]MCY1071306.1 hypothetical protein [Nannocystis sp. RBIL2]